MSRQTTQTTSAGIASNSPSESVQAANKTTLSEAPKNKVVSSYEDLEKVVDFSKRPGGPQDCVVSKEFLDQISLGDCANHTFVYKGIRCFEEGFKDAVLAADKHTVQMAIDDRSPPRPELL